MKITAKLISPKLVELTCKPFFGKPFVVTATLVPATRTNDIGVKAKTDLWMLASGREASYEMLEAIDKIQGGLSAVLFGAPT